MSLHHGKVVNMTGREENSSLTFVARALWGEVDIDDELLCTACLTLPYRLVVYVVLLLACLTLLTTARLKVLPAELAQVTQQFASRTASSREQEGHFMPCTLDLIDCMTERKQPRRTFKCGCFSHPLTLYGDSIFSISS